MTAPITVHYLGVAPIPVGHRVEVRVFAVNTAVFGTRLEPKFENPLLTDLDTGIVYGSWVHFDTTLPPEQALSLGMPLTPRTDLNEHVRWRGRVTATRIAANGYGQMQTSMWILPEAGPQG
ncbi:MAG: hypothetical protein U0263_29440 [Polyangiaceae bacterium]|mgnify:CR=1 FL=1